MMTSIQETDQRGPSQVDDPSEEVFEIPVHALPEAGDLMACAESGKCGGSSCHDHAEICE